MGEGTRRAEDLDTRFSYEALRRTPGVRYTQISGFTQGEERGFNVVFARRAKMNETRTQSKFIIDLCQISNLEAYLTKLLAGGQFEVGHISNRKIQPKNQNFH